MLLGEMCSPDVRDLDLNGLVVLAPLGSFEQHGPHLPLTTDTDIATAIAERVERARPDRVLRLPALWAGHSTHHLAFPGTVSVDQMHYIALITDLCRSLATMGARRVFLLNGHGGNDVPVRAALREVKSSSGADGVHFVYASYWMLAGASIRALRESEHGGMNHACELETSLMLHLHPERVRMERAVPDGPKFPSRYRRGDLIQGKPIFTVSEFHEISQTGVVGRPDLATSEKGARFLDAIVLDITAFVDDFLAW
jgi:creatinine amidohydrolase